LAFFLKSNVVINFFAKSSRSLSKKRQYFCQIFRQKYFQNHNIGPWSKHQKFFFKKQDRGSTECRRPPVRQLRLHLADAAGPHPNLEPGLPPGGEVPLVVERQGLVRHRLVFVKVVMNLHFGRKVLGQIFLKICKIILKKIHRKKVNIFLLIMDKMLDFRYWPSKAIFRKFDQ
jgi:hypothetical protein